MGDDKLADSYFGFHRTTFEPAVLDKKTKELIALAVSSAIRCEPCIETHLQKAKVAGATPDEIKEAVYVAAAVNAGSTLTYGSKAWKQA